MLQAQVGAVLLDPEQVKQLVAEPEHVAQGDVQFEQLEPFRYFPLLQTQVAPLILAGSVQDWHDAALVQVAH